MKKLILPFFMIFTICAWSQAQEIQIDLAPGVKEISRTDAAKLGLFSEYENFERAALFQAGEQYILEVYQDQDGQIVRRRENLSSEEVDDLKSRILRALSSRNTGIGLKRKGRPMLIGASVGLGLYYGTTIAALVINNNCSDCSAAAAIPLLTAGGLTLGSVLGTRKTDVTYSMGAMAVNGGILGIGHGFALYALISANDFDGSADGAFLLSSAVSIAEGVSFLQVAKNNQFSPGRGEMWSYGNLWGGLYGLGLTVLAGGENVSGSALAGSTLAGSALGIWASTKLDNKFQNSAGNVIGIGNTTVIGTALAFSIAGATNMTDDRAIAALGLAGATLGSFYGFQQMRDIEYSSRQGRYLAYGTLGGALIGIGISVLALDGGSSGVGLITTAGAFAGFSLVHSRLKFESDQSEDFTRSKLGKVQWAMSPHPFFQTSTRTPESFLANPNASDFIQLSIGLN